MANLKQITMHSIKLNKNVFLENSFRFSFELKFKILTKSNLKCFFLGDKDFGLMFLLTTFVVLTCCLFFYKSYNLIKLGFINLRIMKWTYSITGISVFFFLIRNCNY